MNPRENIEQLLAKNAKTMTWLADEMSKISNKKYTAELLSEKIEKNALEYGEFRLILRIFGYGIAFRKIDR